MGNVKPLFLLVNVLFAVAAVILTGSGIWFSLKLKDITDYRNYEKYQLDTTIRWPQVLPWLLCTIGIIVLLIVCCGVFGSSMNNQALVVTYAVFLFIAILMLIAATCGSAWTMQTKSKTFVRTTIWDIFNEANQKQLVAKRFGELEQEFHCCGANNYIDYLDLRKDIPMSCCDRDNHLCGPTNKFNPRYGCVDVVNYYMYFAFLIGTALAAATAVLGVICLIIAVVMARRLGYQEKVIS